MRKPQPPDESRELEEQDSSAAEPLTLDKPGAGGLSEGTGGEETTEGEEEISGEEISGETIRGEEIVVDEVAIDEVDAEEILSEESAGESVENARVAEEGDAEAATSADSSDEDESMSDHSGPAVDVAALGDAVRAAGELGEGGDQPLLPQLLPSPVERRALLEAIVYIAEDPLPAEQIATALQMPAAVIQADLDQLVKESQQAERGVEVRKVAGGYKMFTKAEHHDAIRSFVKSLRPKLRLSLPALETLAVIAYKQPVTVPEIQAIRGVNAGGVIHTLLSHKLITTAGRKKVIGRPMQYKTTKEFLVQFGLNDLSELPNLKELEELSRQALGEGEEVIQAGRTGAGIIEPSGDAESAVEEERIAAEAGASENEAAAETDADETDNEPRDSAEEPGETVAKEQNSDTEPYEEASNQEAFQNTASAAAAGAGETASNSQGDEPESEEDSEQRN